MVYVSFASLTVNGAETPPEPNPAGLPLMADRLARIEDRQTLLVDSAQKNLDRIYMVFTISSAFFGMLIAFGTARSFFDEKRRGRLEDKHMKTVQDMMSAFGENVTNINAFISSLTGAFSAQAEFATRLKLFDDRLETLHQQQQHEMVSFRSQIDALNSASADLFREAGLHKRDRDSFKKEENRIKLLSLCQRMDTLCLTGDVNGFVSPIAHFVRGLGRFNEMKYAEAVEDIRAARDLANGQMRTPLSQYGNWDTDEVQRNLTIILDESHYHLGIIYYNTGKWEAARREFALAHERYDLDFRSRIYIPELMFFDDTSDPKKTEQEFLAVIAELDNVPSDRRRLMHPNWEECFASLKLRQGNIFLKKLVLPASRSGRWSVLTDDDGDKKALDCYWAAKEASGRLASHVVMWSLAQAMEYAGPGARWEDLKPKDLFREAFLRFRDKAITKTEPILLTLLYYCAAICCHHGEVSGDSPSNYLGLARQQLQRIPDSILVFSPICKLMVAQSDILSEMEQLEQLWQSQRRRVP